MSRKEGQKRKLLVLLEILARETDEKHPLSVPQLVEKLQEHGVVAERKSVYDDLNTLNNLPDTKYEIVQQRGRGGGYYMTEAPFELAELKLLVDAVYASKFITARKSKILIDKLGQFTSTYRQEELDRKVLVSGRIKSTDEKILYTVDALHAAITAGEQVTFKYCDWNLQKRMAPRHDGQLYRVSPWVLVWENGNYYLIAYTEGRLKHYRCRQDAERSPAARHDPRGCRGIRQFRRQYVYAADVRHVQRPAQAGNAAMREPLCRGDDRPVRHRADPDALRRRRALYDDRRDSGQPAVLRLGGRVRHRRRRLRPAGGPRRNEENAGSAAGALPLICNTGVNMVK